MVRERRCKPRLYGELSKRETGAAPVLQFFRRPLLNLRGDSCDQTHTGSRFFSLRTRATRAAVLNPTPQKTPTYAAIPVEAAKQPNPVKSTPESIARAKKWWTLDCAMCHGKDGDGKGETAKDMKLTLADFTDPATLKDRTDGEIFYIIKTATRTCPLKVSASKPKRTGT